MGRASSGAAAKPKRAPSKREALATPTPKKPKRAAVGAVEALERADQEQSELKRKKSWSGRTEDQAIEKILREQFNGWGQGAIDMVECEGLTLRARLHRDCELWRLGQLEMGKLYYIAQRERYSGISPELQVPVLSDADPGCPKLERAIEKCFETVRDFQQLENWMDTQTTVNQKNLAALLRAMLRLPCTMSWECCFLNLSIMRFIVTRELHIQHKATVDACRAAFDRACVRSLGQWKSNGQTYGQWWENNKQIGGFLLDAALADRVFKHQGSSAEVKGGLQMLANSSDLGFSMFGKALKSAAASDIDDLIKVALDNLRGKDVTKDMVTQEREQFLQACEALARDPTTTTTEAKEIVVLYRGVEVVLKSRSALQTFSLSIEALIRSLAVDSANQCLEPLWCESELCQPKPHQFNVDKDLVAQAAASRRALHDWLDPPVLQGLPSGAC